MAEEQEAVKPGQPPQGPPLPQGSSKTYRSADHSRALLNGLVGLREGGILFDVTLKLEGKSVEAHRILLAASCDYFRGMFAGGLREMEQREVQIHGISYSAMCRILDFIYTSELELDVHNVQETLAAACQLQVRRRKVNFTKSAVGMERLPVMWRVTCKIWRFPLIVVVVEERGPVYT
ncbi:hypothetical protein FKM82_023658 [Ascaphus truei]